MNFLKFLLSKSSHKEPNISAPASFAENVRKAIALLHHASNQIDNKDLLILFIKNGIAKEEAEEIFLFLPIAFVRHLLPNVSWPDFYSEMREHKTQRKKYMDSAFYQIIWCETKRYFKQSAHSETIIKIAGRSAEFHSINELLLKGGDLTDINIIPTTIIR